ncbi:hypothetical protein Baya_1083 [Bagarius yarrelli]|uniref:Guanylate cyclase activator 2B n=1 Tax=Bagarius yarrelli TaxID=175774 RepID=A0A556TK32_BAGYA|nr:hypothetical protein Baya_1083 [Bagarius yarrelli]
MSLTFNNYLQDGEYFFSLESVKVLQQLLGSSSDPKQQNPRIVKTSNVAVCANPTLPQEFMEVCHQSGSSLVFSRLAEEADSANSFPQDEAKPQLSLKKEDVEALSFKEPCSPE